MMADWLAAIAALPKILDMTMKFIVYMQARFGPDWDQQLAKLHEATVALEGAKTDAERIKALSAILSASRAK